MPKMPAYSAGRLFMTHSRALALAAIVLSLPAVALADTPANHDVSVLHCARLVDPVAGKLLGATTVIVEDGRIKELRSGTVDGKPYQDAANKAGAGFQQIELA